MADEKARRTLNLTPDDAKPLIKIIQVSQVLSDNESGAATESFSFRRHSVTERAGGRLALNEFDKETPHEYP
ncbi:hypothetical protein [Duffyella gerundensis]|jgi:hypothetical protein|uniref:hypothetical protein n=1 Tax=Duffyella gerundensis TaxID=1619313 RepID=UPI0016541575|nr:hypothetical protein [Duffyella gerundensis]QTO55572.1 hypothetical protein J8I88_06885 [Duffyella gerundensis]